MRFLAKFLGIAVLAVAGIGLLGWVVMALWNAVLPGVFIGVRAIDYRQALGLLVLSRILFGGFRGRGRFPGRRWQRLEGHRRSDLDSGRIDDVGSETATRIFHERRGNRVQETAGHHRACGSFRSLRGKSGLRPGLSRECVRDATNRAR